MKLESWLSLLEQRHPRAIDLGLERCGAVYRRLGSPRPARRVFTVAGTNGKGSTVAYLAAMSGALGQRFGTYTSPHLFCFNERVCLLGEAVGDDLLTAAFERVEAARGEISLTYFEFTTLAALQILAQADLDCAVLEVGLGGRLDAVNLVDADCAVITPIGLDHQDFLGPDLFSIATEKAGILREGRPVVCTERQPPAPILQAAAGLRAPVYRRGVDFELSARVQAAGAPWCFSMAGESMSLAAPAMAGAHQIDNLAAALAAFLLENPGAARQAEEISAAISACRVPGRLQKVCASPEVIVDVGHNDMAAEVVAEYLQQTGRAGAFCVLGMLADKPAEKVALALDRVCARWLCATTPGPRGQAGEALAGRLRAALPAAAVEAFATPEAAVHQALSGVAEGGTILVFGSFSTIPGVVRCLQNSVRHRGPDAVRINGH